MNCRKGHHCLTVFADLVARRVVFATEGKDHTTFTRFAEEILKHNGHPKAITAVAMDLSKACQKGAREELGNAQMVFDPFHVTALVGEAVDEVRRREAASTPELGAMLRRTIHVFRKNPEHLTEQEEGRLESWIHWVRGKCERYGESLAPLVKVANTIEKHLEGILPHWTPAG